VSGIRQTGSRTIADVGFTRLDEVTIEAPDGSTAIRYALRLADAVAVVPLDGDDVVLIEQYRAPIGERLLEIPAGVLDVPGEEPTATASRELEEEIGFRPLSLAHVIDLVMSPGVVDQVISIYVADGLEAMTRKPEGIEERYAEVHRMPLSEAIDLVRTGRIRDGKSIVGLLLAGQR
jgi:ADP-ribose pyrophosphatase